MKKITVYDEFFKKEFTGEFETAEEALEFYAEELDCSPEDVKIVRIEDMELEAVLAELGIAKEDIFRIDGIASEMIFGYEVVKKNIDTFGMKQVFKIYPNVPISDGTTRPIYHRNPNNLSVYLNKRI